RVGIVLVRRRCVELDGRPLKERLHLLGEALLGDGPFLVATPVFEPSDDHRVIRQIDHRAGPERRHDLTLANLTRRLDVPASFSGRHQLSSPSAGKSTSVPFSCLSQRHTDGSTSRRDRGAVNFWKSLSSVASSGSRGTCKRTG